MRWLLKWAIQKTISLLPDSQALNYQFQKYVTKSLYPSKAAISRHLGFSAQHLSYFEQFSIMNRTPAQVVELGTGWMPTVCVGLWLCGIDHIYTLDIQDLKKSEVIDGILNTLCDFTFDELKQIMPRTRSERFDRLKALVAAQTPSSALFAEMGITFVIGDTRQTALASRSIDLLISNATLEHIPGPTIREIFQEFRRIAAPQAVMSHLIDESDHYCHFDSSITPYHFLQHGALTWKLVNNSILYMNRLRVSDYREFHRQAGFDIVSEVNEGHVDDLDGIRFAREFQAYSHEDLAVTQSWFVSKPI